MLSATGPRWLLGAAHVDAIAQLDVRYTSLVLSSSKRALFGALSVQGLPSTLSLSLDFSLVVFAMARAALETSVTELCEEYGWEEPVKTWILGDDGLGAQSLEDFIFCVPDEKAWVAIVDSIPGIQNKLRQRGRVVRAWLDLRQSHREAQHLKRKRSDDGDLDAMLDKPAMDRIADAFHARYKLAWPPCVEPSDALVSRLSKEIAGRVLSVRQIWKVQSQLHQLTAGRKRTKIGDIEIVQDLDDDPRPSRSVRAYLGLLFTLCVGYARAGVHARSDAPEAPEKFGSRSVEYVQCPLDVVVKYHTRAARQTAKVPGAAQLDWLVSRDEAERAEWVEVFRTSQNAIGSSDCVRVRS